MNLFDLDLEKMTIEDIKNTFQEHGNMEININYLVKNLLEDINIKIDVTKEHSEKMKNEEQDSSNPYINHMSYLTVFELLIEAYKGVQKDVQKIYEVVKDYDYKGIKYKDIKKSAD